MKLSVGTSGYSYKEWKGPFYPEKLPAKDMLRFYAEKLPAVEINNTFYRLPKESVLENWSEQVTEGFRFSIKASRRITHFKRLKDAADETGYLLRTIEALGDHLGVVLFQLPPNLKCDLDRFDAFLDILPAGTRAAFEFRHPSWHDEPVVERLRERAFALVCVDSDDASDDVVSTAPWGYLRLRRAGYLPADLVHTAREIEKTRWEEAFVFFKHEDEGAGPMLAAQFLQVASPELADRKAVSVRPRRAARKTG